MQVNIDLSNILEAMNKAFHFLLVDKNRIIVLRGGAGSGKSYSVLQSLLFHILNDYDTKPHHFLLLRKTLPAAKKSIVPLLESLMKQWGVFDLVERNKSDNTYTFTNGSIISVFSLDDPEKIKSIFGIEKIFLEEANEFTVNDYRQLNLRLRGDKTAIYQIILAFNPVSKTSWLYNEFFLGGLANTTLHHSTYKDNKFLDDEYIKQLEGLVHKDKQFYNIYTLGEWGSLEGLVYTNWSVIDVFPEDIKYNVYGVDFGFSAPSAITRVGLEDTGIYIDEVFYKTQHTNEQLIEFIKNNLSVDEIYCDSAEPARIKSMRAAGINAKKSDKSIKVGIDFVKNYSIYVTRGSVNLITELNTYKWPDAVDGKNEKDVPVDFMNHACDSFRYPLYTKWGMKRTFGVVV